MVTESGATRLITALVLYSLFLGIAHGAVPPRENTAFTVEGADVRADTIRKELGS